jgi:hypothetical protein
MSHLADASHNLVLIDASILVNPAFSTLEAEVALQMDAYRSLNIEMLLIENMEKMLAIL